MSPVDRPTAENARRTRCVHGHELTPENVYVHPNGRWRTCRICWRAHKRAIKARRKERAFAAQAELREGGSRVSVRHLWNIGAPWTFCGQRLTVQLREQTAKATRDCKNCLKIKRQRDARSVLAGESSTTEE